MSTSFFTNGQDAFSYLLGAIQGAQVAIEIQMFIWRDDEIGLLMGEAILAAANRGVQVTLSKDAMGGVFEYGEEHKRSFFHPKLPLSLRLMARILDKAYPMAGKPTGYKQSPHPLALKILNHPNIQVMCHRVQNDHSKYYIFDDSVLVISGMNIEYKEWRHDLLGRPYFDFMAAFHDPGAVQAFRQAKTMVPPTQCQPVAIDNLGMGLDFILNTVIPARVKGTTKAFEARCALINRLQQAKHHVTIVMAYIGDQSLMDTIAALAQKGVKITLYLPISANLQNDLNLKHAKHLMIKCHQHIELFLCHHMIHGKLILIDGDYVTFGSTNLNKQAMSLLQESNVGFSLAAHGQLETLLGAIQEIQVQSTKVNHSDEIHYNPLMGFLEGCL